MTVSDYIQLMFLLSWIVCLIGLGVLAHIHFKSQKAEKYSSTYYQMFCPIKPMLAARMTLDNIMNTFQETKALVETKFDGERLQCHLQNKQVKFFTRNGIDYTTLYGQKLSHLIVSCVNAKCA